MAMKQYNSKGSKKQILILMLITVIMIRKGKESKALQVLFEMQKIICDLDETVSRNKDYILVVNCLTSYILIRIQKQEKVLSFLEISERTLASLFEMQTVGKPSKMTESNLQGLKNVLGLLKNLATKSLGQC